MLLTIYYGSIEICKLLLESSYLRWSFLILNYVDILCNGVQALEISIDMDILKLK